MEIVTLPSRRAVQNQANLDELYQLLACLACELKASKKHEAAKYFTWLIDSMQKQSAHDRNLTLKYLAMSTKFFQFIDFNDKEQEIYSEVLLFSAEFVQA